MVKTIIKNDSHRLKEVTKGIVDSLKEKGVGEDIIFDIYIGVEEALRNAYIHGNESDESKNVIIETEINNDYIMIAIEDEGKGFRPEAVPDPTLEENLLKESGRGVYMIRHLMDTVYYEEHGRRVRMIKYFNKKHL